MPIQTLKWERNALVLLDQTRLPTEIVHIACADVEAVAEAIGEHREHSEDGDTGARARHVRRHQTLHRWRERCHDVGRSFFFAAPALASLPRKPVLGISLSKQGKSSLIADVESWTLDGSFALRPRL